MDKQDTDNDEMDGYNLSLTRRQLTKTIYSLPGKAMEQTIPPWCINLALGREPLSRYKFKKRQ